MIPKLLPTWLPSKLKSVKSRRRCYRLIRRPQLGGSEWRQKRGNGGRWSQRCAGTRDSRCGHSIGAGTDMAVESAGIVLVRSDPRDVVGAVELSRAAYRIMVQNLVCPPDLSAPTKDVPKVPKPLLERAA